MVVLVFLWANAGIIEARLVERPVDLDQAVRASLIGPQCGGWPFDGPGSGLASKLSRLRVGLDLRRNCFGDAD
jgi:hypothetical protein